MTSTARLLAPRRGIAGELARLARAATGQDPAIRIRAWDGSEAGPAHGPVLVLRGPAVLRRVLWQPGELGLAQAYIAGDIDVEGDLAEALGRVLRQARRARAARPGAAAWPLLRGAALAARLGAIGPRPVPPLPAARLSGPVHSRERDRAAVSFHYDLPDEFYGLILDPSMAYSCAYWTSAEPGYALASAQQDKLRLACSQLRAGPGTRILDVGCGWGSLALYAARQHGARVTAVTLSRPQRDYAARRAAALGLGGLVDARLQDYREIDDGPYDAAAAIEMGEHVGHDQYEDFARRLRGLVRPGGRVLIQQMSRGPRAPAGGAFITAYIAPDMHMRPAGETIAILERAGLEVRQVQALGEHYAPTILAWLAALERRWPEAVGLVGEPTARAWRLYLAGAAGAFAERRMGVEQILAVR